MRTVVRSTGSVERISAQMLASNTDEQRRRSRHPTAPAMTCTKGDRSAFDSGPGVITKTGFPEPVCCSVCFLGDRDT